LCSQAVAAVIEQREAELSQADHPDYENRLAGQNVILAGLYVDAALIPANRAEAPRLLDRADTYLDATLERPKTGRGNPHLTASLFQIYMDGFRTRSQGAEPDPEYARSLRPKVTALESSDQKIGDQARLAMHALYASDGVLAFPSTGREAGQLWNGADNGHQYPFYTLEPAENPGARRVKVPHAIMTNPATFCDHSKVLARNFPEIFQQAVREATGQDMGAYNATTTILRSLGAKHPNPDEARAVQLAAARVRDTKTTFVRRLEPNQ